MTGDRLRIGVRELCERGFDGGIEWSSLGRGWIPGRARQGQLAHQRLQRAAMDADPEILCELPVEWSGTLLDREVELHGRIDLLHPDGTVEEIKTVLAQANRLAGFRETDFPGHAMQALLYAWMHEPREILHARLRLINLADGAERVFELERKASELLQFLEAQVALAISASQHRMGLVRARTALSRKLRFPYDEHRPGQRELIRDVENAVQRGQHLLLSAPTGLGKSVGVLLPALRAGLASGRRVFFCTAKNTGREAALRVREALALKGAEVPTLAMASRESMCPAEVYYCHEEHCPFLSGLAQRLPAALADLRDEGVVGSAQLVAAGVRHRVCPHEIALALSETRELVVGDYNYVFDPGVRIRRLFVEGDPAEWVVVVDEAHNLPPRARGWFSETLSHEDLALAEEALAQRIAGGDLFHGGALQQACRGLLKAVGRLRVWMDGFEEMLDGDFEFQRDPERQVFGAVFDLTALEEIRGHWERHLVAYLLTSVLNGIVQARDPLLDFHRRLERFAELAARPGEAMHRVIRVEAPGRGAAGLPLVAGGATLVFEVLCSWAGDWLGEQLARFGASVLFSATLKPWDWNLRELGLAGDARATTLEAASPFPPGNRNLVIHEGLSSRWKDRRRGLPALARLVEGVFARVGGTTAVFLPSFAYLRDLRERLSPGLPLLVHDGSLEPALREALLKRLQQGGPWLLLTVMGGVFAEAVDYPGRMLECAVVVGPGLPQISHERELARLYYEGRGESGFDNAYRLPGLTRVLQAAGRVIRRPEDRGSILLLCDRFSEWENLSLIEEFYGARPRQCEAEQELLEWVERFHRG